MSTVHAFFSQRKKDLASGVASDDTATAEKLFGAAVPAAAPAKRTFHVAVQGCCHGELDHIYHTCAEHERDTNKKIDLLICCGDFQSTRNAADLGSMAVPDKYKVLGDFPRYYRPVRDDGEDVATPSDAPYLTLFVGGNHENSDWLAEESYGGFLAPNIYYLGHSGVVEVDGQLRVGGLSGIFKAMDYGRPYPTQRPYSSSGEGGKRSAYHVRRIEQEKLRCYCRAMELLRAGRAARKEAAAASAAGEGEAGPLRMVDVMVSHDWPAGITKYGNEEQLLRYKPYFRDEVAHNALGNPHTMTLLRESRPQHWLAAHLHCFFTASVQHAMGAGGSRVCATSFMALDKCAKGKGFLDFLDIPIVAMATTPTTTTTTTVAALDTDGEEMTKRRDYRRRVRRDGVWLEVLRRSHRYLAANACDENGLGIGFDAETVARDIADTILAREADAPRKEMAGDRASQGAATTAGLLTAMDLSPVVPLQVPMSSPAHAGHEQQQQQQHRPRDNGMGRGTAQTNRPHGRPPPQRADIPIPQPPLRESQQPEAPPPAPLEQLGWAEDLG